MTPPPDLVLVPREPTNVMCECGPLIGETSGGRTPAITTSQADEVYRAMIASAPSQEGAVTDRDSIIDECAEVARDAFFEAMKEYALIGPAGVGMMMFNSIRSLKKRDGSDKM